MKRGIRYEGRILKDLKRLDPETQSRILFAMERFASSGNGDVRPLRGEFGGSYRLRIGKWRVYFLLENTDLVAYQIDNRGEAY